MLLNYIGEEIEEPILRDLLETTRRGTSVINILMLNASLPKVKVELHQWSLTYLRKYLETEQQPCIAILKTGALPHWEGQDSFHAIVVNGFDDRHIFINDPFFDEKEFQVPIEFFLTAWSTLGNVAITIERL
jgi:ABC-type bacteriocin/lantibiotic exporter with double-glycine peptidase domain